MQQLSAIILFLTTLLWGAAGQAQHLDVHYFDKADSSRDYYLAVVPEQTPKALLVLLPGAFQNPEQVLQQTELPMDAAKQGILTVVPMLAPGISSFYIDSASQQSLQHQIGLIRRQYKLDKQVFYLGGFSLGGSGAVRYAALAAAQGWPAPNAVFAIDPPLDFERYYLAARRILRLSQPGTVNQEPAYMMQRIEQLMMGTPEQARDNYYRMSPYSFSDTAQRGVKLLLQTPLLLITEPDVSWWLRERGYDYNFMNCSDQAAMINELQRLGNKRAVLMTTRERGFRLPDHKRHPHAFSIADSQVLLQWLQENSNGH